LRVDQDTEVLDLKRKGNTLEGKIDGDLLTFVRKYRVLNSQWDHARWSIPLPPDVRDLPSP
jgi:hypothetical protein